MTMFARCGKIRSFRSYLSEILILLNNLDSCIHDYFRNAFVWLVSNDIILLCLKDECGIFFLFYLQAQHSFVLRKLFESTKLPLMEGKSVG